MRGKRQWLKWLVISLGACVGLIVAAVAGVLWYVTTPRFEERLIALAEAQTGRDITVNGRMHVALWPVIGLSAEQVTISNVEGGSAPQFIAAEEIDVGVDFAAALRREVLVRRLHLERPVLNLEVDAQGRGNWILAPAAGPAPAPPPGPAAPAADMRIESIRITGGRVSFLDRRVNQSFEALDLDLSTRLDGLDKPAAVTGDFIYRDEQVDLEAEVGSPRAMRAGQTTALSFTAASRLINLSFDGEVAAASGALNGPIQASGPNVRELAQWVGVALPAGETLRAFTLAGALTLAPQRYNFEGATLTLDAIEASGDFALETSRERPRITGAVAIKALDLNAYLGQPGAAAAQAASVEPVAQAAALDVSAGPWSRETIQLEVLRTMDANLDVTTGPLTVFRTTVDRAALNVRLDAGLLQLGLQDIGLYQGSGTGRIEVDARGPVTRFSQDLSLDGVQLDRVLSDVFGLDVLQGSGQVRLAVTAAGANQAEIVSSLQGRAGLVLNQGAIRGLDIGGLTQTIGRAMRNELAQPGAQTTFSALSLSLDINAGRAATRDFFVTIPGDLSVGAVGAFDLVQQRVDLRFMPRGRLVTTPFVMRGPIAGPLTFESDLRGRFREEFDRLSRLGPIR